MVKPGGVLFVVRIYRTVGKTGINAATNEVAKSMVVWRA